MKATIMRRAAGGAGRDPELSPASPGRGDLHPGARHAPGTGGGFRHDRGDRRRTPGAGQPQPGGCLSRAHRPDGEAPAMIRVFTYLAWRSAHNRVARQLRHSEVRATWPRSCSGWPTSGSWWSRNGPSGLRSSWPARAGSSWSARSALLGAVAWGWIFGVERRVLAFSPAEVNFPLLGPGFPTGADPVQAASQPAPHPLQCPPLDPDPVAGAVRGLALARVISIWVLLTTLSFHRLGASFVRTSLAEHGRLGLRHRVVSLVVLGAVLIALTWSMPSACRAGRRWRAGRRRVSWRR